MKNKNSIAAALLFAALSGCAALPTFMQPTNEVSQDAEGGWLFLDAVDTLQTVQIARHPQCYHEADGIADKLYGSAHPSVGEAVGINTVLALGHLAVAAWLDREVDKHLAADAAMPGLDSVGPWYSARIVFHTVSIGGTSYAVLNNFSNGISPWKTGCR